MTPSKRLAKDKLRLFEALAAYANMKDTPAEWQRFRVMYPDFFPQELSAWMYQGAEEWHGFRAHVGSTLPPMLWYRNRLRSVWARTDQHGYSLAVLLGFEQEAQTIAEAHCGEIGFEPLSRTAQIPGRSVTDALTPIARGFPHGKAVIDGVTGQLRWEFGCKLQQAIYELMQERWRAKICPTCGKYFVAMKTAGKLCSVPCSDAAKRKRSRTWWNEQGSERRAKARTK